MPQDPGLIQTKLVPPRVPSTVVRRRRLHDRLDDHHGGVILVSAPAGFGKTVLVLDWLASRGLPTGWLSVDPFDNDPARFLAHLGAAFARLDVPGADRAGSLIRGLGAGEGRGPLPPGLLDALSEIGRDAVVVLDDVHELEGRAVVSVLEALLHAPVEGPRLMLLTRVDPQFGMGRLRLAGELLELRERDLRCTSAEAVELFDALVPGAIEPALVERLEQRTEGWVAGLRMAAIAIRDAEDPVAVVESFAGSHRYIVEYLLEEAVERQSPEVQRFLMETSVLRRFRPDTCAAVTGDPEAATRLAEVESANLFLVALGGDRQWYRYHRLFGELLQFRLGRLYPDRLDLLHRRASAWFAAEGDIHAALEHASLLSEPEPLMELLDQHALGMLARSEIATVRHWLGRVPDPLSQPYPMLLSMLGWVRVLTERAPDLQPILDAISAALERVPPDYDPDRMRNASREREILSAFSARFTGRYQEAIEISERTLAGLRPEDALMNGLLTFNMARAYMALGEMVPAGELLERAQDHNLRASNLYLVLVGLGQAAAVAVQTDGVQRASEALAGAVAFAEERGLSRLPAFSTVLYHLGHVEYLADSLGPARDAFRRAVELGRATEFPEGLANGLVGLARVAIARREFDEAESHLIDAASLAQAQNAGFMDTSIDLERSRLAFAREIAGAAPPAPLIAAATDPDGPAVWSALRETEHVLALWQAVRGERFGPAAALAECLERESRSRGRGIGLCVALAVRALLPDAEEDRWERVEELLQLAAIRGYARPLLNGGEPVRALLQAAVSRPLSTTSRAYATHLLERFDDQTPGRSPSPAAALVEPLTEREEEVLGYLFQDLSNKAIARAMFVSSETVKTHLKHLYGKLGVGDRKRAVTRARELGLDPTSVAPHG